MESKNRGYGEARPKRPSPNHFVAVQITNPQIKERMEHVQKYIVAQQAMFEDATVEVATAHLTLMVLCINVDDDGPPTDGDDMARAKAALESCGKRLQHLARHPLHLQVTGLGNFRDQVVFAKVEEGEALDNLRYIADMVRTSFGKHGLPTTDSRAFNPHITVMKMSNAPDLYKEGIRGIPAQLYKKYSDVPYGRQTVVGLQLCVIGDRDETGYYKIAHSVPLVPSDFTDSGPDAKTSKDCSQDFDFSLPGNLAESGP